MANKHASIRVSQVDKKLVKNSLTYFCMPCYGPGWAHWGGPLRCRHRPGTCVRAPVWTSSIVVSHALKMRTRSNFLRDACTQKENKINLEPGAKPLCCQSVITAEKVKSKSKGKVGASYFVGWF